MVLLAQQASPEQTGVWLLCFASLLGIAWLSRQLWLSFFPTPTPKTAENEYVTRRELDSAVVEIKADIKSEIAGLTESLTGKFTDKIETMRDQFVQVKEQYRDLRSYASATAHETKDSLHALGMKIVQIQTALEMSATLPRIHTRPKKMSDTNIRLEEEEEDGE